MPSVAKDFLRCQQADDKSSTTELLQREDVTSPSAKRKIRFAVYLVGVEHFSLVFIGMSLAETKRERKEKREKEKRKRKRGKTNLRPSSRMT